MRADAQDRGSVRRHCLCEGSRRLAWQPQCDRPHGLFYSRGGKSWLIRGTPVVCRAQAGRVEAQVEGAARAARAAARVGRAAAPVAWAVAADPAVSPVVVVAWAVVADLAASPAVGGVEWVAVVVTQVGQVGNPVVADQVADPADRAEARVAESPVVADPVVDPAAARVDPAAASLVVEAARVAVVVGSRAAAADDRIRKHEGAPKRAPLSHPSVIGLHMFAKPTRRRFR